MQNFQNLFSFNKVGTNSEEPHLLQYMYNMYYNTYQYMIQHITIQMSFLDSLEIWYIKWLKSKNFKVLLISYEI